MVLDNNNNIIDFPGDSNHSISFKCKLQVIGNTGNGGTKMLIMVPIRYLSNFWKTFGIQLINVSVVNLSTHDNVISFKQLESGFKITINWIKVYSKEQIKCKTDIYFFNWSEFLRRK